MKRYDFWLIIITIVILAALGAVSAAGSGYAWLASGGDASRNATPRYGDYISVMNAVSGPFFVALALALVLCIPKRVTARSNLILLTLGLLIAGIAVAAVAGVALGIGVLLTGAMITQGVVIALTIAGRRPLRFLTVGFFAQLGSGLLHLGLVAFLFDVMLLRETATAHTIVFWFATATIVAGMTLALYQKELSAVFHLATKDDSRPSGS